MTQWGFPIEVVPWILVVYATAGAGHRRAAEAIAASAARHWPDARVECRDVLDDTPRVFRVSYPWMYQLLVQHLPWVWQVGYGMLDHGFVYAAIRPLRRLWNRLVAGRFLARLKAEPPDVLIATHFFPADLAASGKRAGWLKTKLVTVITDWHPHRIWISSETDAFVVASQESVSDAEAAGARPGTVQVIGIPTAATEKSGVHEVRRRLGLDPQRFTLLVTSGGTTVGPFYRIVEALLELEASRPGRLQLVVVCGEDSRTAEKLKSLAEKTHAPMKVFGFVGNMPELMRAADLIVTKAGGLTIAEGLAHGVPLVIYHAIPGQERFNARYISGKGAAVMARKPDEVVAALQRALDDKAYLEALKRAANQLSRPDAAEAIIREVVQPLLKGSG